MLVKNLPEPLEASDDTLIIIDNNSTCPTTPGHRIRMPSAEDETSNSPKSNCQNNNNNNKRRLTTTTTEIFDSNGKTAKIDCSKRKLITEYFPVRRSVRKTKKVVLEQRQRDLEHKVLCGIEDGLQVKNFTGKGRGVITTRAFVKGEFVVEYSGDLIDQVTAKKREAKYAKDQNAGCYMYYFQHKNQQYCVDATAESDRLGRLVNHSRNGNLATRIVQVGSEPHLILIAKEDISAGVELSYDYGDRSRESIRNHPWLAM